MLMLQKVLRVKSFLFACCFCFFVSVASDAIFGAAKLKYLMAS